jgi:hypothetical protein
VTHAAHPRPKNAAAIEGHPDLKALVPAEILARLG